MQGLTFSFFGFENAYAHPQKLWLGDFTSLVDRNTLMRLPKKAFMVAETRRLRH